ncbi:maleylpyruvate isomerase family mycothiol-dependent enzyme [Pseudonocardia sp. TMWB2A]|uniref:maleylpyruvate isomerase family mycothiol-dependent enzyme n=1 Tax=Pseudonocardia sp. TMWB2A TaxID=687430 RepID=UPI00307FBEFB
MAADERRAQVTLYSGLSDDEWDVPSLCTGWRVRDVLAHTTMPFRWSVPRLLLGVVRARGSFDRFADRAARDDAAALTPDELLACLDAHVEDPWSPPGGGPVGALSHDVIHGLDVALALGRLEHVSPERATTVLASMRPEHLRSFGTTIDGLRLVATDTGPVRGDGAEVRGRAAYLLAAVCGRRVPEEALTGPGAARLA